MLFDTHCHLDFSPFHPHFSAELAKAKQEGVERFLIPSVNRDNWEAVARLAAEHQEIYYSLGIHPVFIDAAASLLLKPAFEKKATDKQYLANLTLELEQAILQRDKKCVAIGECGLDRASSFSFEQQKSIFVDQIELATQYALPLILHNRQAHHEITALLKQHAFKEGGVIHAFSGSYEQAMQYVRLGFYIGVGGVITYPRANKTRQAITRLPLSALVLETDAPDMPINGFQGEANHPQKLPIILNELALLRQQEKQTIANQMWINACLLFKLP